MTASSSLPSLTAAVVIAVLQCSSNNNNIATRLKIINNSVKWMNLLLSFLTHDLICFGDIKRCNGSEDEV
jgi:hypothetical protein